jgi:hypothetical protein
LFDCCLRAAPLPTNVVSGPVRVMTVARLFEHRICSERNGSSSRAALPTRAPISHPM